MDFYKNICPNAEKLVHDFVIEHIKDASIAAALLRLHFHDCFVRGCDASLLLESTLDSGKKTEKNAPLSLTLRQFDFVDEVKRLLEDKCPGVVSCADILALVARDAVGAIGGPTWDVPTGRKDGLVSNGTETLTQLPFPTDNLTTLQDKFKQKGLNMQDLVVLSGSHTIGTSHCTSFAARLYNFTGKGGPDPTMDPAYVDNLKTKKCKSISSTNRVEMDPGSSEKFDRNYYANVLMGRGLFSSDAALLTNDKSRSIINKIIEGRSVNFYEEFAKSMVKMGNIEVKTGNDGEVRKICTQVNT
ncbi:Peroxidase 3 [Striga hermonthica]|uniref:Peroxidase n=1 Tax=Striga hermonthica TaxID=68872 RepID=A0A9N7R824_STRHE|nr:Peroxidase 3 [Striga hermonthica]